MGMLMSRQLLSFRRHILFFMSGLDAGYAALLPGGLRIPDESTAGNGHMDETHSCVKCVLFIFFAFAALCV